MASTRYELRKTQSGYTAWDTKTGTPATVDGVWQVGLEIQNADDLTDSLNWLDSLENDVAAFVEASP